jgi:hypothetical protein
LDVTAEDNLGVAWCDGRIGEFGKAGRTGNAEGKWT